MTLALAGLFLIRSSILLLVGLCLSFALGKWPRRSRAVLRLTLILVPLVLVLPADVPSAPIQISDGSRSAAPVTYEGTVRTPVLAIAGDPLPSSVPSPSLEPSSPPVAPAAAIGSGQSPAPVQINSAATLQIDYALILWILGSTLSIGWTGVGLWRLAALRRSLPTADFPEVAQAASRLRIKPPTVCIGELGSPFVALAPGRTLFLPSAWRSLLVDDARHLVALHELAHLSTNDLEWRLIERLVGAAVWFQPLLLAVRARLSALNEDAADQAVLRRLCDPEPYVSALVDLTAASSRLTYGLVEGAVASSSLKARVKSILAFKPVSPLHPRVFLGATGIAGVCAVSAFALTSVDGSSRYKLAPAYDPYPGAVRLTVKDFDGSLVTTAEAWMQGAKDEEPVPLIFSEGSLVIERRLAATIGQRVFFFRRKDGSVDFVRRGHSSELILRKPSSQAIQISGSVSGLSSVRVRRVLVPDERATYSALGEYRPFLSSAKLPNAIQAILPIDSSGIALLRGYPLGSQALVEGSVPETSQEPVKVLGTAIPSKINLVPGLVLTGQLLKEGRPIENVRVWGQAERQQGWIGGSITDSKGSFSISGLRPGRIKALAGTLESPNSLIDIGTRIASKDQKTIRFGVYDFAPTARLSGRLLDGKGRPISNRMVALSSRMDQAIWLGSNVGESSTQQSKTDSAGRFRFDAQASNWVLSLDSQRERDPREVGPGVTNLEGGERLIIDPISARVKLSIRTDALSRSHQWQPLPKTPALGHLLSVLEADGTPLMEGVCTTLSKGSDGSDDLGLIETFAVSKGHAWITSPEGQPNQESTVVIKRPDGSFDFARLWPRKSRLKELTIRRPKRVTLEVKWAGGRPAARLGVRFAGASRVESDGSVTSVQPENQLSYRDQTTDSAGRASFEGMPEGARLQFRAEMEGMVLVESSRTPLPGGQGDLLRCTIGPGGKVSGRVLCKGQPVTRALVLLTSADDPGAAMLAVPNHLGDYESDPLPPGRYDVQLQLAKQGAIRGTSRGGVIVRSGRTTAGTDLEVLSRIVLTGRVLTRDGRPALGVEVTVRDASREPSNVQMPVRADTGARFRLEVPPGNWTIMVPAEIKESKGGLIGRASDGYRFEMDRIPPGLMVRPAWDFKSF